MAEEIPIRSGVLEEVVELFGYIRETDYGRWFDVRSQVNPINLAYTQLSLQVHTDNPYRDQLPTLQLLTCLENDAEGGESILIDGFKIVQSLKQNYPDAFKILSEYCARFEYQGRDGVCLTSRRPMNEFKPDIIHSHLFEAELVSRFCNYKNARWYSHLHDNMVQLERLSWHSISKKNLTNFFKMQ